MTRLKLPLEDVCVLPGLAAHKYMNINVPHAKMQTPFATWAGLGPCIQRDTSLRAFRSSGDASIPRCNVALHRQGLHTNPVPL